MLYIYIKKLKINPFVGLQNWNYNVLVTCLDAIDYMNIIWLY